MPKECFISLPSDKQEKILAAALQEFSLHVYGDTSINQVIKEAGIPRGSFYQYFENKEDLYFTVIEEILHAKLTNFLANRDSETSNDLFTFHESIFKFSLTLLSDEKYRFLFRNLFLSMNFHFNRKVRKIIENTRLNVLSGLNPQSSELTHMTDLLEITQLITQELLLSKIVDDRSDEEIMVEYNRKLKLLKPESK